jgi:DDE superfamily endonuclease
VELACLEPIARGLHITHWSSLDLARQAMDDGVVESISPRTVRRILHDVDLQPHRTRYWKTSRMDAEFKERAEKVLWCYGNAEKLASQGIWVVCVDEIPNFQILERSPIRRAAPGLIERQEYEYTRHGTVNILMFLVVHSGKMEAVCNGNKDAVHYIQSLKDFRRRHRYLKGVYLIQDSDPTHTAGTTEQYFVDHRDWWRPRFTPVHASWLDQAEMLIGAFNGRYMKRDSWRSKEEFMEHIDAAWPEYNRRYAHPFEWYWTNQQMRQWFAAHAGK